MPGHIMLPKQISLASESNSTARDHLLQGEKFRPPNENDGLCYHSPQVVWHGSLKEVFVERAPGKDTHSPELCKIPSFSKKTQV